MPKDLQPGRATTRMRPQPPVPTPNAPLEREPRQARGVERMESLLDAAASLIAEHGVDGVSLQALAQRAGATTGSIYHFFGSRDGIFRALYDRYAAGFRQVNGVLLSTPLATWSRMRVERFVESFFAPVARYLHDNPAFVVLGGDGTWKHPAVDIELSQATAQHFVSILADRWPDAARDELRLTTQMVFAMGDGVFQEMARSNAAQAKRLFAEFTSATAAYLRWKSQHWRGAAVTRRSKRA